MRTWLVNKRKMQGFTQTAIAQKCGISQQAYSFIENAERSPSVKIAKKIASTLGFDWTLFFEDTKSAS